MSAFPGRSDIATSADVNVLGGTVSDLDCVPDGWQAASIGQLIDAHLLTVRNGFAQGVHNTDGFGVPHLRPFNISNAGDIDLSQIKYVAPPDENSELCLMPGDVVFNNTNSEELVGKTAFFDLLGRYALSNHMTIIRIVQDVDARWLAYHLHHWWKLGLFRALCRRHVNQASISIERLRSVPLLLPPLAEQRAIARVLRTVQRAREAAERVVAATRQLKQAMLRHLFTYGPVPVESAAQIELRETPFGPVPKHWQVLPLAAVALVQTGVAKGRKLDAPDLVELPYLRVANVQDGYLDLSDIKYIKVPSRDVLRYSLQKGDVLLTEGGGFDKLGRGFVWSGEIAPCLHQNHVFAVRASTSRLLPNYLAYLAQCPYGKAYFLQVAHKTTIACINSSKLKAFPVLLPPDAEQEAIISILRAVDAHLAAQEKRLRALNVLFASLLHHLMTGRVRVPEVADVGLAADGGV